jgi:hypothetical protein
VLVRTSTVAVRARLAGTRPQFHPHLAPHRRLRHRRPEMPGLVRQRPVPEAPDDEVQPVALAACDRLVEIGLPIRQENPLAARRRPAHFLHHARPALRFARAVRPLPPRLALLFPGRARARPALLAQQAQHRAFGPLFQRPGLHPHGQRAVQEQAAAPPIADEAQVLGRSMAGVVQFGGVLDEQNLAGILTGAPGAGPVRVRMRS